MAKKSKVSVEAGLTASIAVTAAIRSHFSIQHIQSAAHQARLAAKEEENYDGTFSEVRKVKHKSYVTSALFAAVAFVEAEINEFFADMADERVQGYDDIPEGHIQGQLDSKVVDLLTDMWRGLIGRKYSTLDKYQLALTLTRSATFDSGAQPYQDIDDLISLRNAIMHPEPEWVVTQSGDPEVMPTVQKLEKRLSDKNFALSPFYNDKGNPFFPDKCLSYGCSKWAIEACLAFTDDFFERLAVTAPYDHIRDRLDLPEADES